MRKLLLLTTLFSLLFLIGCKGGGTGASQTTAPAETADEKQAYIDNHPSLTELEKRCILDGQVRVGVRASIIPAIYGTPEKMEAATQITDNEKVYVEYPSRGKKFLVEDEGGIVIVVGIETMPIE